VVVDDDINVHDMNDVIWAITTRIDAARDRTRSLVCRTAFKETFRTL